MADVPCPLGMLLDAVAIAIARMDFEVESHDLHAAANHATRCRSLDDAARIWQLAAGVREACRTQGREGASTWVMVDGMSRLLTDAIEAIGWGEAEPWLRDRDRVRELLGEILAVAPPPVVVDAIVMRSAAPATPLAGVERRAARAAGDKGDWGEKVRHKGGRRPKGAGASRRDESAWWRDHADAIQGIREVDVDVGRLFEQLVEYGEVSLRDLGRETIPLWWPRSPDGSPKSVIRFKDRFDGVSPETFKKYLQRHDNAEERPIAHRHHARNVEPATEPRARAIRDDRASAAIREIDYATELAAELLISPDRQHEILSEIRRTLRWEEDDVDYLCTLTPKEMTETLLRRRDKIEKVSREIAGGTKTRG
jgi:hypothetical protein